MQIFEIIKAIEETSSTKDKTELLKQGAKLSGFCELLNYCYDPFKTYRVQKISYPQKYNTVQPDILKELFELCDMLAKHTTTPAAAKGMIKNLLYKCTEDNAKYVARVFQKDLKIGIGVTSINKAIGDIIPDFKVQLALPMEKFDKTKNKLVDFWDTLGYPVAIEEKYDGMRIIAACDGESVRFFSREGMEYDTLDYLAPQILSLRPGTKYVLDGEVIGIKYNPNCAAAKKCFDAGEHWEFAQGLSMAKTGNMGKGTPYPVMEMKEHLGFIVWDIIDYDEFQSSGKVGPRHPLKVRKMELAAMFIRQEADPLKNVLLSDTRLAFSKADIQEFNDSVLQRGGEGTMVKRLDRPYEFKRSDAVLKVKEFRTADLKVIGAFEGKVGTKYENMLGGIVVSDCGALNEDPSKPIVAEVGSGFDDDQRVDLWFRHLRGELEGTIYEVKYFEITPDLSLRFPTALRERSDKSEVSWN